MVGKVVKNSPNKQNLDSISAWIQELDPKIIGIIIAVLVIFFTTLIFIAIRRRIKRQAILLVGLVESGKTLLFSQLVHEKYVATFTSMKDNIGTYTCQKKGTLIIHDIPGHERLHGRFFDQFKNTARALIFVIDSTTFQKRVKDVAEYIYTILTDAVIATNCVPVLIFCNKQDQTMAKGCQVIQAMLEKEINTLRVTKGSQLQSTGGTANNNTFLGKRGKDFEFAHVYPIRVDFEEGNAGSEPDLDALQQWIIKVA